MLGERVGLLVRRLSTYRVWRLNYLHVGRTCRAVRSIDCQPTGFGGYSICMLGELVGL